jgi:hypothetical protein
MAMVITMRDQYYLDNMNYTTSTYMRRYLTMKRYMGAYNEPTRGRLCSTIHITMIMELNIDNHG